MPEYKGVEIDTKPTKQIADEASLGIRYREEYERGGTRIGITRARQLQKRETLSFETTDQKDWPELRYDDQERHIKAVSETDDSVIVEFAKAEEEQPQDEPEEVDVQELVAESSYGNDEDDRMIETGQLSRIFDFDRSAID